MGELLTLTWPVYLDVIKYSGVVSFLIPQRDPGAEVDNEQVKDVRRLMQVNSEARHEVLEGHNLERFINTNGRLEYCFVKWSLTLFKPEHRELSDPKLWLNRVGKNNSRHYF